MKDKNEGRSGYKKTRVGWIPDAWMDPRLEEVCSMKSGNTITSKSISKNGQYRCFGGNGLRGYTSTYTHDGELILIGRQGALSGNVHLVTGKFYASEHAIVTTPSMATKTLWLSELLKFKKLNRYTESSAQPGLSVSKVLRIRVPVPPFPEQEAIADVLECWDKVIRGYEKKIEKKRNIKKGLMKRLLSGKQRLPGFEGEWKEVRLGKIISIAYGKDWKNVKSSNGGIPVYGTGGLMGYAEKALFQPPAILLGRKGTIDSPIYIDEPFWAVDTTFAIHATADIDMVFLHNKLLTIQWYRYNEASGVPSLSRNTVQGIHITIPNRCAEQRVIASVLSSADAEISVLERKLAALKEQKRFLLNNLVTGTIRLPEFRRDEDVK